MRKYLVLFIFILVFVLSYSPVIAESENEAVVVVSEDILTVTELENKIDARAHMTTEKAKESAIERFIDRQVKLKLIEKKNIQFTDEDIYKSMRSLESAITSQIRDTYPLGHFDGSSPSIEEIAKRLADFDEIDGTAELLLEDAEIMAIERVINEHYKEKAEGKLKEGKYDEVIKDEMNEFITDAKEQIEEFTKEERKEYEDDIQWIKEMTLESYKEENWEKYRDRKREKLRREEQKEVKEEINIEIKTETLHQ